MGIDRRDVRSGEYAAVVFGEAGWPAFRFFADASPAGHRFGLLPVGGATHHLESWRPMPTQ
jgi:hypothetical protein